MSIAEYEQTLDEILGYAKERLIVVEENVTRLTNEKESIEEDIGILTARLETIRRGLFAKTKAYEAVCKLSEESDEAFKKLKYSSKTLLLAFRQEYKRIDYMVRESERIPIY